MIFSRQACGEETSCDFCAEPAAEETNGGLFFAAGCPSSGRPRTLEPCERPAVTLPLEGEL